MSSAPLSPREPPASSSTLGKQKRTSNACETCRHSKVKCSGSQPCTTCQRRHVECVFLEESKKVAVSARYLSTLQSQAKSRSSALPEHSPCEETSTDSHAARSRPSIGLGRGLFIEPQIPSESTSPTPHLGSPTHSTANRDVENEPDITWNPFPTNSSFLRNKRLSGRAYAYLGPSSTWGFNLRLTSMMLNHLNSDRPNDIPFSLCGDAYQLKWVTTSVTGTPDISGLPSQDYTLYLFNTVKFHLGQTFRLFDEKSFIEHINEFYDDAPAKVTRSRLWFTQFLLMLAFGKAFLLTSTISSEPPGGSYFVRAMANMPDLSILWDDPLLAIETYSLVSLYLYSIDMRESAYLYIGQAIRIAMMEGMHLEFPMDQEDPKVSKRRSQLWWTIYILDQRISSSLGGPMSVPDEMITIPLYSPNDSSQRDTMLSLHVQVSRLICKVLQTVYSNEAGSYTSHLERIKGVLHQMAVLARSLEEIIQSKFRSSIETLPKGTIHAVLAFHHCTILGIRPLLIVALKERLSRCGSSSLTISTTFKSLIRTCLRSATSTLKLLAYLFENNLLECFLPFDLDFTYSSVIVLTTINILFPQMLSANNFRREADKLLDEMVAKGNRLAHLRKTDLKLLRQVFETLLERERAPKSPAPNRRLSDTITVGSTSMSSNEMSIAQSMPLSSPQQNISTTTFSPSSVSSWNPIAMNGHASENPTTYNDLLAQIGVSSNDITILANQINYNEYQAGNNNDWLWDPIPLA